MGNLYEPNCDRLNEPSLDSVTSDKPTEKAFMQKSNKIRILFVSRLIKIQCVGSP